MQESVDTGREDIYQAIHMKKARWGLNSLRRWAEQMYESIEHEYRFLITFHEHNMEREEGIII